MVSSDDELMMGHGIEDVKRLHTSYYLLGVFDFVTRLPVIDKSAI
jgi:hypothetical protein